MEYLSAGYVDYYFGVDLDEQHNPTFSQYQVDSVVQLGITLGGYYQINIQWYVVTNSRWQLLPNDVKTVQLLTAILRLIDFSDYSTLSNQAYI